MSNLFVPVLDIEAAVSSVDDNFKPKLFNNNKRKSKENKFKPKSHRELKKKLKKYKLRRDGQEDPEVLNVSQILVSALKIKSPTNRITSNGINNIEENLRPKNYLFKMGRKKQIIKKKERPCEEDIPVTNDVESKGDRKNLCTNGNVSKATDEGESSLILKANLQQNEIEINKRKEKKQTNAFTLMMDSRNKSIGSNSPGKDLVVDVLDNQDMNEQKNIKAKRNLLLQKMAEAKGSIKRKETEEFQEKLIKKKMEKRAERLKNLVKNIESKPIVKKGKRTSCKEIATKTGPINNNTDLLLGPPKNKLQLVNIFNDSGKNQKNLSRKKEIVTQEDKEFLKKLSPSLKKKENMLCYFKKVETEIEDIFDSEDVEETAAVNKVKLRCKDKNKIKNKKLSLKKDVLDNGNINESHISEGIKKGDVKTLRKKNKTLTNNEKINLLEANECTDPTEYDLMRPRRNVKRPAKYIDDAQLPSSDEELHIFTPKKKKHADQQNKSVLENKVSIDKVQSIPSVKTNKEVKTANTQRVDFKQKDVEPKKSTKLAPIFAIKPQLDAAAIEARQKFLSSGVPEKLKKITEKQAVQSMVLNNFHTVVHVQQNQIVTSETVAEIETLFDESDPDKEIEEFVYKMDSFKSLLMLEEQNKKELLLTTVKKTKTQVMLQNLKQLYPKFPVYRTYRLLKDKNRGQNEDISYFDLDNSIEVINDYIDTNNENPDKLSWTDKYKCTSSKQIIGNFHTTKELKKWLVSWIENDVKPKKNNGGSDSSDFYISDTDSKDSMKSTNNLLVLTGPVGSGKTSLVYAVAAELAIKVLEVNASSKRTGKIMLQDLQEATQSHKVNRGKSSQEYYQKSQEINHNEKLKVNKKRGRPKKTTEVLQIKSEALKKNELLSQLSGSQESVRTCMSLVLIDDADVVFDQDDGFCSAIVQLVQCSKRPVILITSSKSCPHLQRFLQCGKIIDTRPFLPKMLGTWLDIMCLADSGTCWTGLGAKCLDYFNGDIRRTINFLQFLTINHSMAKDENSSQDDDYKISIEDENSNMSWSDREGTDENEEKGKAIIENSVNKQANLLCFNNCPLNVFNVWWNVPRLLIEPIDSDNKDKNIKIKNTKAKDKKKTELDIISNVLDMISFTDCYCHSTKDKQSELIAVPWVNYESDSVSELENLQDYNRNIEIRNEISHSLLSGSIKKAQIDLETESQTDMEFPGMAARREKSRITSRHNELSSFLNPAVVLDRRALALDYWSGCRTICRVEKSRTDSNFKRNNRFCHYLKSANILCKSDSFDNLVNSLKCKRDNVVD